MAFTAPLPANNVKDGDADHPLHHNQIVDAITELRNAPAGGGLPAVGADGQVLTVVNGDAGWADSTGLTEPNFSGVVPVWDKDNSRWGERVGDAVAIAYECILAVGGLDSLTQAKNLDSTVAIGVKVLRDRNRASAGENWNIADRTVDGCVFIGDMTGIDSARNPDQNVTGAVAVGSAATITGSDAVALGSGAHATEDSAVAVGAVSRASDGSVAIGCNAFATGKTAVAIGYRASSDSEDHVQIGKNSHTYTNICVGSDRLVPLSELKALVAGSADWNDFVANVAALV